MASGASRHPQGAAAFALDHHASTLAGRRPAVRDQLASRACANPLAQALGTPLAAGTPPPSIDRVRKRSVPGRAPSGDEVRFWTKPRAPGPVSSACGESQAGLHEIRTLRIKNSYEIESLTTNLLRF